jgi:hypothetical protein
MDLRAKIVKALSEFLQVDYIRLEEDDGVSGFVVSPRFQEISTVDRQGLIEEALSKASDPLTPRERRQVLMIAGLTPEEYDAVGARIRVHRVKEMARGKVEVLLHGALSDAEYVREALNNQKGIRTTAPRMVDGARGILMSFRAEGNEGAPLTKERALRILKQDRYIEVMPNA